MPLNLYDAASHRKYLIGVERKAFLKAAEDAPSEGRTLCGTVLYTGFRISDVLALTAQRVDLKHSRISFASPKKSNRGVCRPVRDGGCLLCSEGKPHDGQRRLLAEYPKDKWGSVQLEHIP